LRIPFAHNIGSFAHYGRLKDNEPGAVIYIAATGKASRQKDFHLFVAAQVLGQGIRRLEPITQLKLLRDLNA
jgi:hypothetical protein